MSDSTRTPTLFELGPQVVPIDVRMGTRKTRRSSARAWKLLVQLENANDFSALASAWEACVAARLDGTVDEPAHEVLSRAWERRREELRPKRDRRDEPKRKGKRR